MVPVVVAADKHDAAEAADNGIAGKGAQPTFVVKAVDIQQEQVYNNGQKLLLLMKMMMMVMMMMWWWWRIN